KETATTDRSYAVAEGQFLVVTHDLPVVSRITRASPERPYLAVILSLDHTILADLHDHAAALPDPTGDDPYALSVGEAGAELIDAFVRCLRSLDQPADASVLLPLATREIHYRLLCSPQGRTLRRLSLGQGPGGTVSRAIGLIRDDLAAKMSVDTIADHVGLSPSALHHHFKAVTGTSPVQFQKQLRLLEARRLIQSNTQSVTGAAYSVGYSSPAQFSREYRRAFGHPPSQDRLITAPA
ncbi:MAG: AraC family transcriptional regulator, partial [Acidimicrobiales bacterium]|nr:AraC family transcriptional regulator [Acidimicrobiales bacterium]